jgi:hypothetical protein
LIVYQKWSKRCKNIWTIILAQLENFINEMISWTFLKNYQSGPTLNETLQKTYEKSFWLSWKISLMKWFPFQSEKITILDLTTLSHEKPSLKFFFKVVMFCLFQQTGWYNSQQLLSLMKHIFHSHKFYFSVGITLFVSSCSIF